ncbi:peptidoglycan-binding protein [Patescibacteria group bacterium]|nr:peptidoglycan-binding protein [Patescibacteria group bacterium]
MNELKYQITQLVFLVLLGLGGYWALTSLDTGVTYTRDQIVEVQHEQSSDEQVNAVNNETVLVVEDEPVDTEPTTPVVENELTTSHEELIADLQAMVDAKVSIDSGASGDRVGTVQEFLAVYFSDRTVNIDKDFGPTTKGLVKEFQQKELNGGDGRVGPNTLKAMIEYLEN